MLVWGSVAWCVYLASCTCWVLQVVTAKYILTNGSWVSSSTNLVPYSHCSVATIPTEFTVIMSYICLTHVLHSLIQRAVIKINLALMQWFWHLLELGSDLKFLIAAVEHRWTRQSLASRFDVSGDRGRNDDCQAQSCEDFNERVNRLSLSWLPFMLSSYATQNMKELVRTKHAQQCYSSATAVQ